MRLKKLLLLAVISASIFAVTSCVSNKKKNNATSTIPSSSVVTTQPSTKPSTVPSVVPSTTPSVVPSTPSTAPSTPSTPVPTTPSTPSEPEYKENGTNIGSIENGTGKVLTEGQIEVLSCSGLIEAGYVVYNKVDAANSYNIYVKGNKYQEFTLVDKKIAYTKEVSETQIRTDLLGLSSGTYQIKLVPVVAGAESNATATVVELGVKAYDRSGYAHFNYTAGIGAYNDDGTLKDNAIVIYVTDENKDYVMSEICEEYNINMFNIPNEMTNNWNNKEAKGIGWWLNNAQYTKATKDSNGNVNASKTSNTYSSQGQSLGFYSVTENHPIAIRFVGTVTTPEGCTAYDSYGEGGSPGDNGHMARMKDLNNVTLEGVGVDAKIEGWGFHFMASDTTNVRGKSFEARNLTFDKYPEDALGMEGTQEDSTKTIKASVERCWVHHCTFLPGYCANPAESDKSEGDGSCDFKRGQYFTMSYCYYEYCHKTNLIGSGDDSLQYNITFHHNFWYNCGSRIPLARQANIHFYNNYIYGNINTAVELSYVSSIRANAYMYSENNYYEGCKQVFETGNSGAVAKVFGNTYIGCFKTNFVECSVTDAQTRDEKIDVCNCAYKDISYKNFDTNPDLFYYDVEKQQSDCYLTTSTVAREECIKFAGSYYRTILNKTTSSILNTNSNQYTPTSSIDMSSGSFTATLPTTKDNQVISNIMYNNINSVSSGLVKFRGQGVTFMVDTYVTVNAVMTGSKSDAMYSGNIVKSNGQVMLNGSGSAVLSPGIYYIVSCQMDGDTSLTSLTFEKYNSEEVKAEAIANYNAAYNNIPADITYTNDCYLKIQSAIDAYTSLGEWKSDVLTTPYAAYNEYMALGVSYVEGLISTIGTVNVDSGLAILAAREAYDSLIQKCPAAEVSNYTTLTAAEEAFKNFAVLSCINKIDAIGTVTLESKDLIA
ncbi:MAG: hypothetical protein IJA65_01805, partial [Acholeplasmatales bacterium]|nr:hypothetical protein [Acholeplasmatales bacterium]